MFKANKWQFKIFFSKLALSAPKPSGHIHSLSSSPAFPQGFTFFRKLISKENVLLIPANVNWGNYSSTFPMVNISLIHLASHEEIIFLFQKPRSAGENAISTAAPVVRNSLTSSHVMAFHVFLVNYFQLQFLIFFSQFSLVIYFIHSSDSVYA